MPSIDAPEDLTATRYQLTREGLHWGRGLDDLGQLAWVISNHNDAFGPMTAAEARLVLQWSVQDLLARRDPALYGAAIAQQQRMERSLEALLNVALLIGLVRAARA